MKIFWTIVSQWESGALWYFTGNIREGNKPEFAVSIHDAIEFTTKEDAEFGLFMLGSDSGKRLEVQEHQIGW